MNAPCPTPWKQTFPSRASARDLLRRAKGPTKDGQIRPYLCPCGAWHLTSMSRREVKNVLKRQRSRSAA